jgi:hypothetical protein
MATTSASPVFRTLPATVANKPAVHQINIGLGTPSATFTTVVLTAADAGQDNNNATLATAINSIIEGLRLAGVFEKITGAP